MALRLLLWVCAAGLPPQELLVLQQLGSEACGSRAVQCEDGHVTKLILEGRNFTELPETLGELQHLKHLDLDHNALVSLPDAVGQLRNLRYLSVMKNQLQHLPETLGDLKMLTDLDLSHNQLQHVPETLGRLSSLWELRLNSNRLRALPETFGHLLALESMDLSSNQLELLPEALGALRSLRELDLCKNRLRRVPESLGELEDLKEVDFSNNQLTSLPESLGGLKSLERLLLYSNELRQVPDTLGDLQSLEHLDVNGNQLQRLPETIGQLLSLKDLLAAKNLLTHLPAGLGELKSLEHLALQQNRLEDFVPGTELQLESLEVLLLQHNALQCSVERFCHLPRLTTLYLHGSHIEGALPACLASLKRLQVLTLHQNQLRGTIPASLAQLDDLKVLTLHSNQLSGSIPQDFVASKSLAFFSASDNVLTGSVPELNLTEGCADDPSFTLSGEFMGQPFELSCRELAGLQPQMQMKGLDFQLLLSQNPLLELGCPATLGRCRSASARGPTLLLHGNRLSCAVPVQVTQAPSGLRSLVLIGNALGNESKALPPWVARMERQPFLYVSSPSVWHLCVRLVALPLFSALAWWAAVGGWSVAQAPQDPTELSHLFLIEATWFFAPLALLLLYLYASTSSYYTCGDRLLASTVAYFQGDGPDRLFTSIGWCLWVLGSALLLRMVPKAPSHAAQRPSGNRKLKIKWWTAWFCLVLCLSTPSMAYTVASSLPRHNIIGPWVLWAIKNQAALVMLLVDMLITPKLAATISRRSGVRRSMLLMAARSCTMWLNATIATIYLNEHCQRGWTRLWTVCDASSKDYKLFNISLGQHPLLEPLEDLCQQNQQWWASDACLRSVVGTLAPLFLSKMIQRAFLQPVITLVLWKLSVEEGGELFCRPLAMLGVRWRICTSRSLDRAQQATFLVTLAEVVLIWGPFIPLLIPAAALAAMTNLRVFRAGTRVFGAKVPELEEGETGSMSTKYTVGSVVVLLIFQNWFAWTAQMNGRSLLFLTTLAFLGSMIAPTKLHSETPEERSVELTSMN